MDFETAREAMVDRLVDAGHVERERTAEALRAVPRHEFVPEERRESAYRDAPLPIGDGQTISAPHMVGVMCDLLALESGDRVLEIGTGCGYHAAVTAELVGSWNVYSVEYVPELADRARETLERLGYEVHVRTGDGREGWSEHAPYEAAYLTCATAEIPAEIPRQVRPGGYVLAPVGSGWQTLDRLRIRPDGTTERESFGGVRFVQMQGD